MTSTLYSGAPAARLFMELLDDHGLQSRVTEYTERIRNPADGKETFYTRRVQSDGVATAEAELAEALSRTRRREVAEAIEPIVDGMCSLAFATSECRWPLAHMVDTREVGSGFPVLPALQGHSITATVFNPWIAGCGCTKPTGYWEFGPDGMLGLKALALIVDTDNPKHSQLNLILPNRNPKPDHVSFVVVTLELDGHASGCCVSARLEEARFLRSSLGLNGIDTAVRYPLDGGRELDEVIGFPGGFDYLVDALPGLVTYLHEVATRLDVTHQH